MLVRVTLPDGHHFLTTLSPNPLSYNSVWKGVSRERYLEIDTSFAKQLGITAPNIEVSLCAPFISQDFHTYVYSSHQILLNCVVQYVMVTLGTGASGCYREVALLMSIVSPPSDLNRQFFCDGHRTYRNVVHASNFACALSHSPTMHSIQLVIVLMCVIN